MAVQLALLTGLIEGTHACYHHEQRHSERENVALDAVVWLFGHLSWALESPRTRHTCQLVRLLELRGAKVSDLWIEVAVEQDVLGLEVEVYYFLGV